MAAHLPGHLRPGLIEATLTPTTVSSRWDLPGHLRPGLIEAMLAAGISEPLSRIFRGISAPASLKPLLQGANGNIGLRIFRGISAPASLKRCC